MGGCIFSSKRAISLKWEKIEPMLSIKRGNALCFKIHEAFGAHHENLKQGVDPYHYH